MKQAKIIGIAGKAHSGKDIAASMIMYQLLVDNPTYNEWNNRHYITNVLLRENLIIHFADPLKQVLSIITGLSIKQINENKDKGYFLWDKQELVGDNYPNDYTKIDINTLKRFNLNTFIASYNSKIAISIRTLLQYVGTELMKKKFANDIWIRPTINKAHEIANRYSLCIIPDVRFKDEEEAIHNIGGKVIRIWRDNAHIEYHNSNHSSEEINIFADKTIDNNGSLQDLYNEIAKLIKDEVL
nr:MAG TPA: deoxynucleoside monophosphate kinase [Crassvirales sp.]